MTLTDVPVARRRNAALIAAESGVPVLDVVVPVFNEQAVLADSIHRLHRHLREDFPFSFRITIADNASADRTPLIAQALADALPHVRVVRLEERGRGRALRAVWSVSDATVLAYMDADLSTDLAALAPLIAPLVSGHSDLAIGTRLGRGSRVVRGAKREVISRCYNLLLRSTLAARFSDAQCGFKAIRADVAAELLSQVEDTGWFFDTELLVLAERRGLRIHEVPVDWVDDPDSRVDVLATALADLRGIARLLRGFTTGHQGVRFAAVGIVCTAAYLTLYLVLRPIGAQNANLVALLVTAVANTAANRRFTFGVRGGVNVARHHVEGLVVFAVGLGMTSAALAILDDVGKPSRAVEVAVLLLANLAATVVRFLLLRGWVFHPRRIAGTPDART